MPAMPSSSVLPSKATQLRPRIMTRGRRIALGLRGCSSQYSSSSACACCASFSFSGCTGVMPIKKPFISYNASGRAVRLYLSRFLADVHLPAKCFAEAPAVHPFRSLGALSTTTQQFARCVWNTWRVRLFNWTAGPFTIGRSAEWGVLEIPTRFGPAALRERDQLLHRLDRRIGNSIRITRRANLPDHLHRLQIDDRNPRIVVDRGE